MRRSMACKRDRFEPWSVHMSKIDYRFFEERSQIERDTVI